MIFFSEFDGSKKNEYNFFQIAKGYSKEIIFYARSMSNFFKKEYREGWGKVDNAIKANGLQD